MLACEEVCVVFGLGSAPSSAGFATEVRLRTSSLEMFSEFAVCLIFGYTTTLKSTRFTGPFAAKFNPFPMRPGVQVEHVSSVEANCPAHATVEQFFSAHDL
jgi:hypothetical protein